MLAAGAGIHAFYTPTGVGTVVAEGKEERRFGDRDFILEEALHADFALIRARKADPFGNLRFWKTARNFSPLMATAAETTIVEADELVSLGAVVPFLSVLSDPERFWKQPLVQALANEMGFIQASQLLLPASLMFAVAAVFAGLIRLTNLWLNGRLSAAVGSDLSCEAYRRTLYQPYSVHLQFNSAEVITGTTTHINQTVVALRSLLKMITSVVVAAGLLTGLLLIDAPVALSAAALFGCAYGVLITLEAGAETKQLPVQKLLLSRSKRYRRG